jgi:hypothetical protein
MPVKGWLFAGGVALVVGGLALASVAPDLPLGIVVLFAGVALLAGLVVYAYWLLARQHNNTYAVNPGAARREARAERDAARRRARQRTETDREDKTSGS